jgi:hypothetical protein
MKNSRIYITEKTNREKMEQKYLINQKGRLKRKAKVM